MGSRLLPWPSYYGSKARAYLFEGDPQSLVRVLVSSGSLGEHGAIGLHPRKRRLGAVTKPPEPLPAEVEVALSLELGSLEGARPLKSHPLSLISGPQLGVQILSLLRDHYMGRHQSYLKRLPSGNQHRHSGPTILHCSWLRLHIRSHPLRRALTRHCLRRERVIM